MAAAAGSATWEGDGEERWSRERHHARGVLRARRCFRARLSRLEAGLEGARPADCGEGVLLERPLEHLQLRVVLQAGPLRV